MDAPHKAQLDTFTLENIPDLDTVVLGALELFAGTELPVYPFDAHTHPLVVGSVNAYTTGRILFQDSQAFFAEESTFEEVLAKRSEIDAIIIVSSSGGKHAVTVAEHAAKLGKPVHLITNNSEPLAGQYIGTEQIHVFQKNREPYTYNTSTYMGMIMAKTGEDPAMIYNFIEERIERTLLRDLQDYSAFTFIVPSAFGLVRDMMRTKFDELFGPYVLGRIFTEEEVKHAKTVVTSGAELFISVGVENEHYGLQKNRLSVPLPENADYAAMLAIGYYVIGKIQAAHPPYFKNSIEEYCKTVSEIFEQEIKPIVE